MQKYFKNGKHMRILAVMLALIFACTAGFAYANTESAGVTEANYRLGLSKYESNMGVGDEKIISSFDFYRLTDNYRNVETIRSDRYTVECFQPEILCAEIKAPYSTSKNEYLVLNAISPGTATIRVTNQSGSIVAEAQVKVLGSEDFVIDGFPEGMKTIKKSNVITIEKEYTAIYSDSYKKKFKTDEQIVLTSSNPKVAAIETVESSYYASQRIRGLSKGTATITATFATEGALQGIVRTFDVTVTEDPKATTPKILDQIATGDEISYSGCGVGFRIKGQPAVYEFWRSTSPKKNFKKVGSITIVEDSITKGVLRKKGDNLMSYDAGDKLIFEDGKKLKQNTKYYYKMRVKYTGAERNNSWSAWSRVTGAYWTGVKPFKFDDKRIKLNKKTRKVTIPKSSTKVRGYIYSVGASKHLGYNIFGQEVRYRSGARRITTKRIFTVKSIDGMRVSVVYDVVPYTKHGKYYYVHGYKPMKSVNRFKEYFGAEKYVNY